MKIRRVTPLVILLFALVLVLPAPLRAEEPAPLRYEIKTDLTLIGISTTGWILMEAFQKDLAPAGCRWCDVNGFDAWGHRNLKWGKTGQANMASHVTAYALAPMAAFGMAALAAHQSGDLSLFIGDALIIAEATTISALVSQVVKISAGRQRPDVHYGAVPATSPTQNTSFYSGHTNFAFALAVSSGTVASMRGYELAPWIWGTGMAVAVTTGYLRVAADRHYLTDVIAGAAIGSAFGFAIPYLFHRPKANSADHPMISAIPVEGGGMIAISGNL